MSEYGSPCDGLPEEYRWENAYRDPAACGIDPQGSVKFHLRRETPIASAGSCFGRRVAADLQTFGFNYVVAETGPAGLDAELRATYNWGVYSARYGDVLTTVQFEQLLLRALGRLAPLESYWEGGEGVFFDPFRPLIQPEGFSSVAELEADRRAHLRAVLRAVTDCEVFVFTPSLIEAWLDRRDGALFPICPGRGRGQYDPERIRYAEFGFAENVRALESAFALLREVNPGIKVIVSLSPGPPPMTFRGPNVVRQTNYGKSVLRAAIESFVSAHAESDYFASFEAATAAGFRAPFFDETGRVVAAAGVSLVMESFYRNYFAIARSDLSPIERSEDVVAFDAMPCDEEQVLAAVAADNS